MSKLRLPGCRPSPLALLILLLAVAGCATTAPGVPAERLPGTRSADADGVVTFTILHMNDVYEITPVEGGASGGLARVATLRQRLLEEDPDVITVLAGDFLSPSALGTARVDGERLAGRQMVSVLNAVGLDVAALGNHEFDVSEEQFRERATEAAFPFVSANVAPTSGVPFPNVVPEVVVPVIEGADTVRVAFASVVIPSNPKPYVTYTDPLLALAAVVDTTRADVIVGLTHLAFAEDATAAATIPTIDLILGGHEHENIRAYRGADWTPILKADANARSVYVHRVTVDTRTGRVTTASEFVPITDALPDDPEVAAVAQRWVEAAYAGFRASGFEPERVAATVGEPLDGREASIRTRPTALGTLIAEGMRQAAGAEAALFNGGSVRLDDVIPPGPFTEYDAIRVLPFGGEVVRVRMPGRLLARVLDQGQANAGTGGYLQTAGIEPSASGWRVAGAPLDPDRLYTIATSDFLLSGRETGLDYLNVETNPDLVEVGRFGDVRRVFLDELARAFGG